MRPDAERDCPPSQRVHSHRGIGKLSAALLLILFWASSVGAVVLWSDLDATLVRNNGNGTDLLAGAVKRDDLANDTLYFKLHVDPLSDETTEPYFAALQLFEGDTGRLGVGNALDAAGYSYFLGSYGTGEPNRVVGHDLRSARPAPAAIGSPVNYQVPQRGVGVTFVFKVQYIVGGDDLVTVWLNPDLGPGATEVNQPEVLTTRFNANAAFDELRLVHAGEGGGWTFSDLAIATAFGDFVDVSSARPGGEEMAAARSGQSLYFRSWTKDQGLPQTPVRALTQTTDGYLWLGSVAGVTRFDGLRFVSGMSRSGTTNHPVRTILGDSHGALWIGCDNGGLQRWHTGEVTPFTDHTGLPSSSVTALAEDNQGNIWIGTDAGLVVWQDGRLMPLNNAQEIAGSPVTALVKDRQGTMWLSAKGRGVFQRVGEAFVPVRDGATEESLKDPHCLLVDHAGRLWVGAGEDVVLCHEENRWHRYRIPRHLAKSFVSALAEEPDGTIWAGSSAGGLLKFAEGKFNSIPPSSGLSGNLVETLLVDREGKLWVGTDQGLNQLQRNGLFALGQNDGLGFGAVQGLAQVSGGVIWAVKPNDGIYRWDGLSFSRLRAAGLSLHNSTINTVLAARDGVCWVAGANGLLRYKDPIAAADEAKFFELPGANILALAEDENGTLWVGTREGKVWWLREGKWIEQNFLSQTNAITAITPGPEGTVWIGTEGAGLMRVSNGKPEHVGWNGELASPVIRALHLDGPGTLWIGTAGGLGRWRNGQFANFTTRDGLPDNTISQILEDDVNRLWLGTSRGVACVSKSRLEDVAAGKLSAVYPKVFTRAEGMLAEECMGGFSPAGLRSQSGLLWFSTTKGVVVIAPQTLPRDAPMPSVVLEEIRVDGVVVDRNAAPLPLRIAPGRHRLEMRYTGLRFEAPESIRFRYQLEGWDSAWLDGGTSRTATYNFVSPGRYRFRVVACNADGIWAEIGAELQLVFERHFWQSWWFIGLAGVGLLTIVGGTARLVERQKMKRRLKRLDQERALERERTRIARDLHDEMGAKLCRISFLSEHARRPGISSTDLQEQITSISEDSREVLHSLDEIVWAVNPQNDTLEHVASYLSQYAHDYFQMTGIECEVDIPKQLPSHSVSSHVRHHLFLAVREATTNILKHSGATNAKVFMACDDSRFEIIVEDNGKGFDPDSVSAQSASTINGDPGDGLPNMHRRLAEMGGLCQCESHPGRGTMVRFILPLQPTANHTK